MHISPIDRNKGTEPEKQISRINSPYWTLPLSGGLGPVPNSSSSHSSEGVILRVRDTRLRERRESYSPSVQQERRVRDNRKLEFRGNTHHILVIAIERKVGESEPWKAGDRVSVVSKTRKLEKPQEKTKSSAETQGQKPPLLVKDEADYVLHLSKSYPEES
ncbi:MAG: hypothetical protein VW455_10590 [Nitrospinota bacterium]